MSINLLATLLSLSVFALFIGLSTSAILLMFKPNNLLFQALEDVRTFINSDDEAPKASQAPLAKSVHPVSIEEETVREAAPPGLSSPVAANADLPVNLPETAPDLVMAKNEVAGQSPDAVLDNTPAAPGSGFLESWDVSGDLDSMRVGQDENQAQNDAAEIEAQAGASEPPEAASIEAFFDDADDHGERVEDSVRVEDLEKQVLEASGVEAEAFNADASSERTPGAKSSAESSSVSLARDEGIEEDTRLENVKPDASSVEIPASESDKFKTAGEVLDADVIHDSEILSSLPVDSPPEQWATPTAPEVSRGEALQSERSTEPLSSFLASAKAEVLIENREAEVNPLGAIDDRQPVSGDSDSRPGPDRFDPSVENDPRIDSNWGDSVGIDRPTSVSDLRPGELNTNFQEGQREGELDGNMQLADVGFRGEALRIPDVSIEDEPVNDAERLRLEALKNNELRGILSSLTSKKDGEPRPKTSVTDLSMEKGPGHERHTTYYVDGSPRTETDWLDGVPDGEFRSWYAGRQPMIEGFYENGNGAGQWTIWDADGNILIKANIGEVLGGMNYKAKVRYIDP